MEEQRAGKEGMVREVSAQERREQGRSPGKWGTGRGLRASPPPSGPGQGRQDLGASHHWWNETLKMVLIYSNCSKNYRYTNIYIYTHDYVYKYRNYTYMCVRPVTSPTGAHRPAPYSSPVEALYAHTSKEEHTV